jgi:HSP20 family protein
MPATDTNIAPTVVHKPKPTTTTPTPTQEPVGISPFRTLERVADEVTRIFDDFGLPHSWSRSAVPGDIVTWAPRVDVIQHKDELLVRVDLPGMQKKDIKINVTDDAVTIQGERHRAQEEERDGVYRCERNYGTFRRTVALPEGTVTDQAKASFSNGVLEIRMPAAPKVEGRAVEIS